MLTKTEKILSTEPLEWGRSYLQQSLSLLQDPDIGVKYKSALIDDMREELLMSLKSLENNNYSSLYMLIPCLNPLLSIS